VVLVHHHHVDFIRVYVRIRTLHDSHSPLALLNFPTQAQLVPQLIINWKLKSVAHMPMKSMVYKSLSTVIDDLFAYVWPRLVTLLLHTHATPGSSSKCLGCTVWLASGTMLCSLSSSTK
jgi:hypothetical protein